MAMPEGENASIDREDIIVTTNDGNPALEVNGAIIELEARMLELTGDAALGNKKAELSVQVESEGKAGAWWEFEREDGDEYPRLVIEPWFQPKSEVSD